MNLPLRFRPPVFKTISIAFALLLSFVLFELVLRGFPILIGVERLARFEPPLRGEIAHRLGLRSEAAMQEITTEMRTDRGPAYHLPRPNSSWITPADNVDLALGAVEKMHMDESGFCNAPEKVKKTVADVVVVGDSFIFCTGVEPIHTAIPMLERMSGLVAYNLGAGGVGPYEYVDILKRYATDLRPRIAILNIYEGNDLRDVIKNKTFIEGLRKKKKAKAPAWSYAAQFINATIRVYRGIGKYGSASKYNFRYSAVVAGEKIPMNVTNSGLDEVAHAMKLRNGEADLDWFAVPIKEYVRWANARNIVPVVTYTPSMYTAYMDTVEFEDGRVGAAVREFSSAQRQWFSEHATPLGFQFLDLTFSFQDAARNGELTHFPANTHLTPKGHEVVARAIAAKLPGYGTGRQNRAYNVFEGFRAKTKSFGKIADL